MKARIPMINGPVPAQTAQKFWNIVDNAEGDAAEITMYGDVCAQQPVDWWTGEPEPGMYITPEGFLEDLALIKDKGQITIKLNSCGGDLYTGIAIHNALKGLKGHKTVIIEGIAASAASVIACAGDDVQVYPGSMIMIHGVAGMFWDYMTIGDLKQGLRRSRAGHRRDLPRENRHRHRHTPQHDDQGDLDGRPDSCRQGLREHSPRRGRPSHDTERRQEGAARRRRSPRRQGLPQHPRRNSGKRRCSRCSRSWHK